MPASPQLRARGAASGPWQPGAACLPASVPLLLRTRWVLAVGRLPVRFPCSEAVGCQQVVHGLNHLASGQVQAGIGHLVGRAVVCLANLLRGRSSVGCRMRAQQLMQCVPSPLLQPGASAEKQKNRPAPAQKDRTERAGPSATRTAISTHSHLGRQQARHLVAQLPHQHCTVVREYNRAHGRRGEELGACSPQRMGTTARGGLVTQVAGAGSLQCQLQLCALAPLQHSAATVCMCPQPAGAPAMRAGALKHAQPSTRSRPCSC